MKKGFSWLLVAMFTGLLGGCATSPEPISPGNQKDWHKHLAQVSALDAWHVQGRVAVNKTNKTNRSGGTAHFDWQQQGDQYHIRLRGPFGQGAVELFGDAQAVRLVRPNQQVITASSAEHLLQQQTGWHLPISSLVYWLRGIPAPPSQTSPLVDEHGRLVHLLQHGWGIAFARYTPFEKLFLPKRLQLKGEGLRVKIIIDEWSQ